MAIRPSSSFVYPTGSTTSTINPKLSFGAHPFTEPPPRIFALIIGINKHKNSPHIPELEGAVPDADAVLDYLVNHLGVPSSQIRNLRDSEATRTAIIEGIVAFSLDHRIKEGDPIIIYYAGHGGSSDPPEGWKVGSSGKIELLVPYDHSSLKDDPKHGIPDRTMGALLSQLASKKGDNITVILDCCHSSSGTRGTQNHQLLDSTFKARAIDVGNIPSDLDRQVWTDFESLEGSELERGTKFHSGFARKGLRSHVLLAACHSQELAYERTSRGVFTVALLETLVDIGIENLTYATLLSRMPPLSSGQNPQCEGFFRERSLFNGQASDKRTTAGLFFKIRKSEGERYVIDEGEAAGITVGAEFEVYQDQGSGDLLGIVVARELSAFSTTLYAKEFGIALKKDSDGVALKSRPGKEEQIRVYVADESLKDLVKKIDPNQIQLVERDRGAEFGMALEDGKVVLNIYDSDATKHRFTRKSHSLEFTFEAISSVIRAAAHFYWHRRRTPKTGRGLAKRVEFEVNELEEDIDEEFKSFYKPITASGNLKVGKDLNLRTETTYGWTISNKWAESLYPALFYFDIGDWSITPYYEPPIAGAIVEPPLKDKGHLPVGYGDSGWAPHTFYLREGQNVDVGVLKLFLSREQVNLSHVAQLSPFASVPVEGHSTAPSSPPSVPIGGHSTAPSSPPLVPIGRRPSTTPSLLFDSSHAAQARATDRVQMRNGSEPKSVTLPWDTVEITVVQRRDNK